jgi:putative acetyltransferase
MITCVRTSSGQADFQSLVKKLDIELKTADGEDHLFYAQFNKIDKIKYVVVAYQDDAPVGCGAIKEFSEDAVEVKRMYVEQTKRGQGIASSVLKELEDWAIEMGFAKVVLETGRRQPDAVRLYKKSNYLVIPNYGQYQNMENSICFEKRLR